MLIFQRLLCNFRILALMAAFSAPLLLSQCSDNRYFSNRHYQNSFVPKEVSDRQSPYEPQHYGNQ